MTLEGYPDYARMSLESGFLLAGATQRINATTTVFQGYVGSWGYVNAFWNAGGGTDNYTINFAYFTDGTFTSQVAVQLGVRNSNIVAWRQYPVLTPWLQIFITPKLGTDTVSITYDFHASNGQANSAQLASLDAGFLDQNGTVAISSNIQVGTTHLIPGSAIMSIHESVTTAWDLKLQRWDFGTSAWVDFFELDAATETANISVEIAMPDAQMQLRVDNTSTTVVLTSIVHIYPLML